MIPAHDAFFFCLNSIGMMALCTVGYGMIQRSVVPQIARQTIFGITMGVGAALLMLQPVRLEDGFQMDSRTVFIGIAATFGGPVAAALAAAITASTRIAIGGSGVFLGCVIILLTATVASAWSHHRSITRKRTMLDWCTLAAVLTFPVFSVVLLPIAHRAEIVMFLLALTLAEVLIFGRLMEAEQRRGRRERVLNAEANTDALTLLPNRRSFLNETTLAEQKQLTMKGLLLIDIDHFKRVNDTYGHDAGDEALRVVGRELAKVTRKSDVVARFGGEEFALLVDAVDAEDLGRIADRVRQALQVKIGYNAAEITLSVSIGGSFCGDHPFRFDDVYLDADRSLYHAKAWGRSRSVITLLAA